MKKATNKDNSNKVEILGQYNTNIIGCDKIISDIISEVKENTLFVEPSFGTGNFIKSFRTRYKNRIVGVEIDEEVFEKSDFVNFTDIHLHCKNFYDFDFSERELVGIDEILVVGNPPYRTPALSLKQKKSEIDRLKKLYKIDGIKEECVFFIVKTYDVVSKTGLDSDFYYILPKTIFQNPTKAFKSFYTFIKEKLNIVSIHNIDKSYFENVSQNLILVKFSTKSTGSNQFKYDGDLVSYDEFLGANTNIIPFNKIFKKTYLGSVPAESFLLSCRGESKLEFKSRLESIFFEQTDLSNLKQKLMFNGQHHLSKIDDKKLEIILNYINEIKSGYDTSIFSNLEFYKPIRHRNEDRFYFRHDLLKRVSFVYIINSKPGPSFFFTSNPTSISTDYWGFTEYDCNRNSSPGSIRTVPIEGLEDNLTDGFKKYWKKYTNLPYKYIFDYMIFIYKSQWYKDLKKTYGKFYFGIPKTFMKEFESEVSRSLTE